MWPLLSASSRAGVSERDDLRPADEEDSSSWLGAAEVSWRPSAASGAELSNEIGRCLPPLVYCHPGAENNSRAPPYKRRDGLTLSKRRYAGRDIRDLFLPFTLLPCNLLRYSFCSLLCSGLLRYLLGRGFLDNNLLHHSLRGRLLSRFLDRRFLRRFRSRPLQRLLLGRRFHFHHGRSWRWCGGWRRRGSRSGSRSSNRRRGCRSRGRFHFRFHLLCPYGARHRVLHPAVGVLLGENRFGSLLESLCLGVSFRCFQQRDVH